MKMTKRFSTALHEQAHSIWQKIFEHPFLQELKAGRLPQEKFRYYLAQDFHYLDGFAKAVGLALAKAPDPGTLTLLAQRVLKPIEKPLHRKLFSLMEVNEAEVEAMRLAPTTLAYVNHLLKTAALGNLGETAAALLPCPWTYHELGRRLGEVRHPIYGEWAVFYTAGWLEESVAAWQALVDAAAAQAGPKAKDAMEGAFLTSSRYEYLFWEMAYTLEGWPA